MIEPRPFLSDIIDPACEALTAITGRNMGTDEARVMLLAIALQESALAHRRQVGQGGKILPTLARGWWQFESGGGVKGVMAHEATSEPAKAVCEALVVPWGQQDIHEALAWHDHLAAAFARLLLYSDAKPLPEIGAQDEAWAYYLRNWRPGKPHPDRWAEVYPAAVEAVRGAPLPVTAQETAPMPEKSGLGQMFAPTTSPLKKGWFTSEFLVALLVGGGPLLLSLLDSAVAFSPALKDAQWVGIAYIIGRALVKAAAMLPVPPPRQEV